MQTIFKSQQMNELIEKVEFWGLQKGILKKENATKQCLKMVEEVGEVSRELLHNDMDKLKLELGDVAVTLIILASQNGFDIKDCLQAAWDKIKDRQGATVDGVFIKN